MNDFARILYITERLMVQMVVMLGLCVWILCMVTYAICRYAPVYFWCELWCVLQTIAFWIDDRTHTCYAGDYVTRIIEKVTPSDSF